MTTSKEQFEALQREWYQKLADSGFDDAEVLVNGEMHLVHRSFQLFFTRPWKKKRKFSVDEINQIADYYMALRGFVECPETEFRNEIDKIVMSKHAEGSKIKDIWLELKAYGKTRDRYSIRIIIRRYEMAWGLRCYTRKQLHRKEI